MPRHRVRMEGRAGGRSRVCVGGDGGTRSSWGRRPWADIPPRLASPVPRQRVFAAGLLTALVAVAGSGCVLAEPPIVECPAIGWINHFDVVVTGSAAAEAAHVTVCSEQKCTRPARTASPRPTHDPSYSITDLDGARWRVQLGFDAPKTVRIDVHGADGSTLGEATADLDWRRVGGSEACGGPHEADPVTVEVP